MMPQIIQSPKSGFVATLAVAAGVTVSANEIVARLDDSAERIALAQLDILSESLRLSRQRMEPGRQSEVRGGYELRKQGVDALIEFRRLSLQERVQGLQTQQYRRTDVAFAEVEVAAVDYERRALELERLSFETSVAAGRTALDKMQQVVDAQRNVALAAQARTVLRAEVPGVLSWYVFEGGYVEAGSPIALIR